MKSESTQTPRQRSVIVVAVVLVLCLSLPASVASTDATVPLLHGGPTCDDERAVYEYSCSERRGRSHYLDTTAVNYVPKELGPISTTAQHTSCSLPVLTHWTFEVIPKKYTSNFGKGLTDVFALKRWAWSGMGIATGTKLFSGTSFSEVTRTGAKVDFRNAHSVPRSMYTQEYFPNSEAFYSFWKWYFPLEVTSGLNIDGTVVDGVNVVDAYADSTRIVVHGVCAKYVDEIKRVLASSKLKHLRAFDFAHPASDTIALISTPPDDAAKKHVVHLDSLEQLNKYGTRPAGWTAPLGQ